MISFDAWRSLNNGGVFGFIRPGMPANENTSTAENDYPLTLEYFAKVKLFTCTVETEQRERARRVVIKNTKHEDNDSAII